MSNWMDDHEFYSPPPDGDVLKQIHELETKCTSLSKMLRYTVRFLMEQDTLHLYTKMLNENKELYTWWEKHNNLNLEVINALNNKKLAYEEQQQILKILK